jgi:hypothetical protein
MKKVLIAAIAAISFTATADPIYIDIGIDFGGNTNTAAGSTTTGWLNQLATQYDSTSILTDNDNNGFLSAGDTILSKGGIFNDNFSSLTDLSNNLISSFEPQETLFGGPSDNDFITDWGLTFGFTNLMGFWTGTGMVYTSGTISMYYYDGSETGVNDLTRLFDLNVVNGGDTGNSTVLAGYLSNFSTGTVNGVAASDVFNNGSGSFTNSDTVYFGVSQDTQSITGVNFVDGKAAIGGTHNGSISFSVPEPTSLAILGLGLLGFAGARRRKS